jgi:hypothetical protein
LGSLTFNRRSTFQPSLRRKRSASSKSLS